MRLHLVEINAKVLIRSDTDPSDLPADLYSRIAEFIASDDDVIDLDVAVYPLPEADAGSAPH
jgi:hypothetical protein